MKPLLLISLPNHWSIKNLVHSGAVAQLEKHFDVELWVQPNRADSLRQLVSEFGLSGVVVPGLTFVEPSKAAKMRQLQKSLLLEMRGGSTEQIIKRSQRGRRSRIQNMNSSVVRMIVKTPFGGSMLQWAERKRQAACAGSAVEFSRRPNLILGTNPFDPIEDGLVAAAAKHGIKMATMIPSWDNLTSKGVIDDRFDTIFVWNQPTVDELIRLYPAYRGTKILPVGLPRTDAFFWPLQGEFERGNFLKSLGLDPAQKTILFANTATKSFPNQPLILDDLLSILQEHEFEDVQLLVRCHPHDSREIYDRFRSLKRVRVWPTADRFGQDFGVQSAPPKDDLLVLSAMIRHADLVVNAASTIVLDAACCDTPIISVAYDGPSKLSYFDSILSAYDYEHQRPYLASGAGVLVHDKDELRVALRESLLNPTLHQAERMSLRKLVNQGESVNQMVNGILQMMPNLQLEATHH